MAELSPIELLSAYAITQDDGTGYARFVYHPKQVLEAGPVKLNGATSAFPIWLNFMKKGHDGEPPLSIRPSADILEISMDQKSRMKAASECLISQVITETFFKDYEPQYTICEALWPASLNKTIGN